MFYVEKKIKWKNWEGECLELIENEKKINISIYFNICIKNHLDKYIYIYIYIYTFETNKKINMHIAYIYIHILFIK